MALNLTGPLMIDIEYYPSRGHCSGPFDLDRARTVEIPMYLSPFKKLTVLDESRERVAGYEVVFAAVLFPVSRSSSRVRDAKDNIGDVLHEPTRESRFSRARGG